METIEAEDLRGRLEKLRIQHRGLDEVIDSMVKMGKQEIIQVQRQKRTKAVFVGADHQAQERAVAGYHRPNKN